MKTVKFRVLICLFIFSASISFILSYKMRAVQAKPVAIIINDEGFLYKKVTIVEGQTVSWEVDGKNLHWPASDFHPTHGGYPEKGGCIGSRLDACKSMKKGEKYVFQFDQAGTWDLHDHLNPGFTMTVHVVPIGKQVNKFSEADPPLDDSGYSSQKQAITKLSKNDPKGAWKLLKETFLVDNQVVGNAHGLAHVIGNEAYNKFGLSGMQVCDDEFAFGCYHGVSEKMLLVLGKDSIKKIEAECTKNWPPEKSQDFTGCIHGTGHGLVGWRGLDLEKALEDCNVLNESNRNYCYNGVMMEYMESAPNFVFDKNDPWKFCLKLEGEYQRLCGQYQIVILTSKFHFGFSQIAKVCATGPNSVLTDTCYHGMGSRTAQQARGDYRTISDACMSIADDYGRSVCIMYAADQVVFQEYKDWENVSLKLCDILEGQKKDKCILQRNQTINFYRKKYP